MPARALESQSEISNLNAAMLKTLVLKEILNNLLNLRFALAYFLCTFLLVGSVSIMLSDYLAWKDVHDANRRVYDRQYTDIGHVWQYMWHNKVVLRPPALTRVFALGGEKDADQRAAVAPEFPPYLYGDFKRNPLTNLFPSVDMVFIVGVIISLLIFVLSYDSIAGEREEGTLKVLLAGPVPRDLIVLAKWLGGFASLVIPLITGWIVVALVLAFSGHLSAGIDVWLRIAALFVVTVLYVAVVFSLSLMVSLLFKSSATAILALLMVWVVLIVAVPAASTSIAYLAIRPQGVQTPAVEMRRIGVLEWSDFDRRLGDTFKEWFGGRDFDELSESERSRWRDYSQEERVGQITHLVDSIVSVGQRASRAEMHVDRSARWLARISPYGCLQNASVALAGTGMQGRQAIREALEDFSRRSTAYAIDHVKSERRDDSFDAEHAPRARILPVQLGDALADCLVDVGLLALMGVLFFLVAYVRFLKMEIQ